MTNKSDNSVYRPSFKDGQKFKEEWDKAVVVKKGFFSFNNDRYYIEFDRIDNPIKLVWWLHHLGGKGWFNRTCSKKLIELATERMGLKMYEGQN